MVKNLSAMPETQVRSLDWEDPWIGKIPGEGNDNPVFLENSMDRGAWWATVHGGHKESDMIERTKLSLPFHALEKEMATHPSVLAWRIPGMGEPGGLPSLGSHRVEQD